MNILATEISNLTDARYFAAWGVEILSFNYNDVLRGALSGQQIKEMIDWIEGPKSALKIDALEIDASMVELISLLEVDHLIVGPFVDDSQIPNSVSNVIRVCSFENLDLFKGDILITSNENFKNLDDSKIEKINSLIQSNPDNRKIFLDFNFDPSDLELISSMNTDGIILKGGEEEKVGFKSYDELDEMFEWLEENQVL